MKKYIIAALVMFCIFPSVTFAQRIDLFAEKKDDSPILLSDELRLTYAQYAMISARTYTSSSAAQSQSTPPVNDPYYSSTGTWGKSYADMWGLKDIDIENAWKLSTGRGAVVAVIDTGVDYNHIDINSNIWTNTAEVNGTTGVDDDRNGYKDDIRGWDFYNVDNNPIDDMGHGTHVAGIIAAKGNNSEGVIGVAYNAAIMALKVFNSTGWGIVQDVADAIRYAVTMGVKIINCSFGMSYSSILADAFQYAYDKGAIVIAAAGNENTIINQYPALLSTAITVGSIDPSNIVSYFSNYGVPLDVVAPGEDILSLRAAGTDMYLGEPGYNPGDNFVPTGDPSAKYYRSDGTSMATPFVSGLVALMLSQDPNLTFAEVGRRLKFSSYDLGAPGWDPLYGWGRIDAFAALSHDWYDSGHVKTWWLTDPDADNVIRYDYFETGETQSKWFKTPDIYDIIRYSYYLSGRLDSEWFFTIDAYGNTRYEYYNENFVGNLGRKYITETSGGASYYNYGLICNAETPLVRHVPSFWTNSGAGNEFSYYNSDLSSIIAKKISLDNGNIAEYSIPGMNQVKVTKYGYTATTGNTAWFLWGTNVYKGYNNVAIECGKKYSVKNTISTGTDPYYAVITPDGGYLYVLNNASTSVSVINTSTNTVIKTITVGTNPRFAAITPDGRYLYVANFSSNSVSVINTSTNTVIKTITVGTNPRFAAITPDGRYLYVVNLNSDNVSVINTSTNSVEKTVSSGGSVGIYSILSPDGKYFYILNSYASSVSIMNTTTNTIVTTVTVGSSPYYASITPDGRYLYILNSGSSSNSVSVINTGTNMVIKTITVGTSPSFSAVTQDGAYLYILNSSSNNVSVIDTSTNTVIKTIAVGTSPKFAAITQQGRYLYVLNSGSGSVSIINTVTNSVEATISVGSGPKFASLTPDRSNIYVVNETSNNVSRVNIDNLWKAYTFIPDLAHPENVVDPTKWTLIETISDPSIVQSLLPELGDWWQYCSDNNIFPEFPALSSDYVKDGLGRVIQRVDHNSYIDTTNVFTWDFQVTGRVKRDVSYDPNKNGLTDLGYSVIYNSGSDYNVDDLNSWAVYQFMNHKYWTGTNTPYQDIYLDSGRNWQKTLEYYSDGVTIHHKWMIDANLSTPGDVTWLTYDTLSRVTEFGYDDGSMESFTYYGDSSNIYQHNFAGPSGVWRKSIQYYPDGVTMQYQWIADPNPSTPGDVIQYNYDTQGRGIKTIFDNGSFLNVEYWGSTSNKFNESFYLAGTVWQWAIEYWNDGVTMHYKWVVDLNPSTTGDSVYYEYNSSGVMIKKVLDDNTTDTYYSEGLIESKALPAPDVAGNLYYHYIEELFYDNGTPSDPSDDYGRVNELARATANTDGVIAYLYDFYSGTDLVHIKYAYGTVDYSNPSAIILTNLIYINVSDYWAGTRNKYRDALVGPDWSWRKTTEYYEDGITMHYQWIVDANPSTPGDATWYIYDTVGRVFQFGYDDGSMESFTYWGTTSNIYQHNFAGLNGVWQKSIQYYEDGVTMQYQWIADPNPATPGDETYAEYDTLGRKIFQKLDGAADPYGCQSYSYTYYDSGNLKEKKSYLDDNWILLAATYSYSDSANSRADVIIQNNVTWQGRAYNFKSITIPSSKTLTITGTASSNAGIQGGGSLVVDGNLTVSFISLGTVTITAGHTLTIAPIPGGPLAGDSFRALNQEAAALIDINTTQGNIYGAGGIPVSPQIAGAANNSTVVDGQVHTTG